MGWSEWEKVKIEERDLDEVIYEQKYLDNAAGVARVTINRPDKLNAYTSKTIDELWEAMDDASMDKRIGVIVLTGAGDRAFCTGGDVEWESSRGSRMQMYTKIIPNHIVRLSRKPVIAAVRGYAIGGGNHLAYFCDFTIAADNARFGQTGPRIGSPADGWPVVYSSKVLGTKKAREMWMLTRQYDAQQALDMGLVNCVVPLDKLDEEVDKWCEEVLNKAPTCIEILKATFDAADMDDQVGQFGIYSRRMAPGIFDSEEVREAQQAFFEKRKPNFLRFRKPE